MGPTSAIFGREFELFMIEEYQFTTCPVEKLEDSIFTSWGTLNKRAFDKEAAIMDGGVKELKKTAISESMLKEKLTVIRIAVNFEP